MKIINILKNIVIIEIILYSGGVRFFGQYAGICMILFIITSFILHFKVNKKILPAYNLKLFFFIVLWPIFNHLFINNDIKSIAFINYVLFPIGSYFAISSFNFYEFRELLYSYFNKLCIISIVVQLLHVFGGLNSTISNIGNKDYGMLMYFFNVDWGENRLSSIYWEPGQFQILIFFIICLYCDSFFNNIIQNLKKFSFLLLALFMTFSTTAYLTFAILLFSIITFSPISKKTKILFPILAMFGGVLFYLIWNSDTVQDKLELRNETGKNSYTIRYDDNLSLLKMSSENPIFGTGFDTKTFQKYSKKYNNETSSNGWFLASATNGIIFILIILYNFYLGIKRMNPQIPTVLIFFILFISQCNEYAIFFPYIYMYIFRFKSYYYMK